MPEDYVELVKQLIGHVSETQTIEFKDSNARFEMIGRDIAALANSAIVEGQDMRIWYGVLRIRRMPLSGHHLIR